MTTTACNRCLRPLPDPDQPCPSCTSLPASAPLGDTLDLDELARLREALTGEFDVAGALGRGGMATVYLAHDLTLDRKVAIKVMSRAVIHGGGAERFRREARTAAALSHPNIIPIYAVREANDLLFFVMKFVPGRPLDSIIAEVGQLPIPMVQAVVAQAAGALGYAHRQGVVHRDVKPGNILIDDEGWAVVTDFGIARAGDATGLTTAGTTVGTPTYMSPEQCLADVPVTGAADQYALGILAYEMLTGTTPFAGKTSLAMMYSHVHDQPAPVRTHRPECPAELAALVERMLAKAPEDRWPNLDEVITALGAVPLSYDDPTRSQLIALAKTGAQQQLSALLRTPRSPIPVMRKPTPSGMPAAVPAASNAGNWARAAVAGAAVLGAAVYFAPWRQAEVVEVPVVVQAAPAAGPAVADSAPAAVAPAQPGTPPPAPAAAPGRPKSAPSAPVAGAPAPTAEPSEVPGALVTLDAPEDDEPQAGVSSGAAVFGVATTSAPARLDREGITRALASYADALANGDLAGALRVFPQMPGGEQERLQQFFGEGGRMKVRLRILALEPGKGGAATARVAGQIVEIPTTGAATRRTVEGSAVVATQKGQWRLREATW